MLIYRRVIDHILRSPRILSHWSDHTAVRNLAFALSFGKKDFGNITRSSVDAAVSFHGVRLGRWVGHHAW